MTSMNFEQARFNMVEQQIRTWDVLNPQVLSVLHDTPREKFVPEAFMNLAYADTDIPLGNDREMCKPLIEARLLQSLDLQADDQVLEIGTGTGYLAALMSQLAKHVYSVEQDAALADKARQNLAAQSANNVTVEQGDALNGWGQHGQYDAIACTASFPADVPEALLNNLKVGGRMFAIVGEAPVMEATLITRISENEWQRDVLFETETAPLAGLSAPKHFVL